MKQKVWVVDDSGFGGTSSRNAWSDFDVPERNRVEASPLPKAPDKSPAWAFSLSLLVWGCGHLYIRRFVPGALLMGSMLLFWTAITSAVVFRDVAMRFLSDGKIPPAIVVIGAVTFILLFLLCWFFGAVDAYMGATKRRSEAFHGVYNEILPVLCSLCFPGWGQFLNGQPRKGIFFLIFGFLGILSISVAVLVLVAWPLPGGGSEKVLLEILLLAAMVCVPVSVLMWMVSVHDAFWTCREPVRKRPLMMRLRFARERIRMHGIRRFFIPGIKRLALSVLILSITLLGGVYFVPTNYYLQSLELARMEMVRNEMALIPQMLDKAVASLR